MSVIYLINPISQHGHLDSYARLYARAVIESGHHVVLLAPTDGGTGAYLARNGVDDAAQRFRFLSFGELDQISYDRLTDTRSHLPVSVRVRLVFREEGLAGIVNRLLTKPLRLLGRKMPGVAGALRKLLAAPSARVPFTSFPGRIAQAEAQTRLAADVVVFLYLDLMGEDRRSLRALERSWRWPWVGLLFHPRSCEVLDAQGIERFFLTRHARGILTLTPDAVPRYGARPLCPPLTVVPDVADLELPPSRHALANQIRVRAGGRTTVLQVGSLTLHKGLLGLVEVISRADPQEFFFALVGRVYWEAFGDDTPRLRAFFGNPPENVLVHCEFIEDERDYNSVLTAADILYAVYRDFPSSSNVLTKAAGLRVPLLVSDRYLMGELVRRFGMGATVPEGDPEAACRALQRLARRSPPASGFQAYAEATSLERLSAILAATFQRVLEQERGVVQ